MVRHTQWRRSGRSSIGPPRANGMTLTLPSLPRRYCIVWTGLDLAMYVCEGGNGMEDKRSVLQLPRRQA
ncbi:hypothetical protein FRB93_000881 [Tulasnella sp. JGI-2019a]|nr:hypothetical protein FRB93_000881 [Tulasnella sp. JGI-2019a]